uniref:Uncharacterized protein n=1 Tax=Photinus pyralis TaxID=7054 RepID=A0A1Y1K0U3_PHOPY
MYINFIKHVKTTGGEAREPPPHYDLLHNILGDKHKITLGHIKDSLQLADTQDELNVIHQPGLSTSAPLSSPQPQPCATTSQQPLTPTSSSSRSQTPTSSSHLLESSTPLSRSHTPHLDSHFQNIRKSVKPPKADVIQTLLTMHKENIDMQTSQFKVLENLMTTQNKLLEQQNAHKATIVSLFESMVKKTTRKRRRHSSDSDDDD